MNTAKIRIYSTCPASGNVFVRIASGNGVGLGLLSASQQLEQNPRPMPQPQADLWLCNDEDRMQPGGGRA